MNLSGIKTVAAAGTAVQLGDADCGAALAVRALDANTGLMYIGNVANDVASSNGYPLEAGESIVFEYVGNLGDLWLDSAVNGEGVAWLILNA